MTITPMSIGTNVSIARSLLLPAETSPYNKAPNPIVDIITDGISITAFF